MNAPRQLLVREIQLAYMLGFTDVEPFRRAMKAGDVPASGWGSEMRDQICPSCGKGAVFRESEVDKLRDALECEKRRLEFWENDARGARDRADAAERHTSAMKGVVTRIKNRAAAGVCSYGYYRRQGLQFRIEGDPGTAEWFKNYEEIHATFEANSGLAAGLEGSKARYRISLDKLRSNLGSVQIRLIYEHALEIETFRAIALQRKHIIDGVIPWTVAKTETDAAVTRAEPRK